WFAPEAAGYIQEKVWHETQEILEQGDGAIVFEAEVAGLDEIRFWVLGWGFLAEVLEPEALREAVRSEAERLVARYEGRGEGVEKRSEPGQGGER
ncbi:MAG: WYL domain-containing protein, partial [Desulfobacteraceae bacterium]